MKKILVMSALAAVSTAFVACSSEDDLAQQAPVVPEVKGTPFKVNLQSTRADLSKTTTANLSTFQLYGIQQTTPKSCWMDNVQFTKSGSDWGSTANPTWPTDNKSTATNFYGFSDGVTDGVPVGLTPSITADAQSFAFTLGDGESSTQYWSTVSLPQALRNNQKSVATVFKDGKYFVYGSDTKPTSDYTEVTSSLPDLLVTQATATESDNNGTVSLNFGHTLSTVTVKAYLVSSAQWPTTYTFCIDWIRIRGLYTSGTYTYGSGWTFDSNSDLKVAYEKSWGEDSPITIPCLDVTTYDTTAKAEAAATTLVNKGEFMIIPQEFTTWTSTGVQGTATSLNTSTETKCYIELYGYVHRQSTSDNFRGTDKVLPLVIKGTAPAEFKAGHNHTIMLDLSRIINPSSGIYTATPSEFME